MPNGRSGAFFLKREEFDRLLCQFEGDTVIGKTLKETVSASELRRILHKWQGDKIPIEEQDRTWYIVHFREWVTVDATSPLFDGFRRYHAQWLQEWSRKHEKL